jgi:hypothetical protein
LGLLRGSGKVWLVSRVMRTQLWMGHVFHLRLRLW